MNISAQSSSVTRIVAILMCSFFGFEVPASGSPTELDAPVSGEVRDDLKGRGCFACPRDGGQRLHNGVDLLAEPKDEVSAPIPGTITKIGYPYGDDLSYRYVEITEVSGVRTRLFYVVPVEGVHVGALVKKGQVIGYMQDVTQRHGSTMKNHLHWEVYNSSGSAIDPLN